MKSFNDLADFSNEELCDLADKAFCELASLVEGPLINMESAINHP